MPNGEIFYVGIGNIKRPYIFRKTGWGARSKFWWNIVEKYGYPIVVVEKQNISWKEATDLEKIYIKKYGRRDLGTGTLVNHTDGGEGCQNWGSPDDRESRRNKISLAVKSWHASFTKEERSLMTKNRISKLSDEQKHNLAVKSLKTFWSAASDEKKHERMNKLHSHESMTTEKRSNRAKEFRSKMTPEQNALMAKKREESMTPEQKQQRSDKIRNALTKEQRSEMVKRSWETRKSKQL